MSISSLTAEASTLLAYFQAERTRIQSALTAALDAIPNKGSVSLWVDSIAGDDAAAGTEAAPKRTLVGAFAGVSAKPGTFIALRLARDGDYLWPEVNFPNSHCVVFGAQYDPRDVGAAVLPIVRQQYTVSGGSIRVSGLSGDRSSIEIFNCDVRSVTPAAEDAALPVSGLIGLVYGGIGIHVWFGTCRLDIGDVDMQSHHAGAISCFGCEFARTGAGKFVDGLGSQPVNLYLASITYPGSESFHDYFGFSAFDAADAPIGVLSNVEITSTTP